VPLPALTQKDYDDLEFFLEAGVDWIAVSFVQKAQDLIDAQEFIAATLAGNPSWPPAPKLIPKIEKPQALVNIASIAEHCQGMMVARGDLGVECGEYKVPAAQKMLIRKGNATCHWMVTATQMMESMRENPVPTRAEVSDVFNAVCDGTVAVMLSVESASGRYPSETVAMMGKVCEEAEQYIWPAGAPARLSAPAAAAYLGHAWCPGVPGEAYSQCPGVPGEAYSHHEAPSVAPAAPALNKVASNRSDRSYRPSPRHSIPEPEPAQAIEQTSCTKLFILVSGKRCAGKDFVGEQMAQVLDKLMRRQGGCHVTTLAASIKRMFATENNLDFDKLISQDRADRDYKEQYREALTQFWESRRPSLDWICSGLVRNGVTEQSDPPAAVMITDWRSPMELQWFTQRGFKLMTVRVECDDDARARRGWIPEPAKDNHATEVAMDSFKGYTLTFDNSVDGTQAVKRWVNSDFLVKAINFTS